MRAITAVKWTLKGWFAENLKENIGKYSRVLAAGALQKLFIDCDCTEGRYESLQRASINKTENVAQKSMFK